VAAACPLGDECARTSTGFVVDPAASQPHRAKVARARQIGSAPRAHGRLSDFLSLSHPQYARAQHIFRTFLIIIQTIFQSQRFTAGKGNSVTLSGAVFTKLAVAMHLEPPLLCQLVLYMLASHTMHYLGDEDRYWKRENNLILL